MRKLLKRCCTNWFTNDYWSASYFATLRRRPVPLDFYSGNISLLVFRTSASIEKPRFLSLNRSILYRCWCPSQEFSYMTASAWRIINNHSIWYIYSGALGAFDVDKVLSATLADNILPSKCNSLIKRLKGDTGLHDLRMKAVSLPCEERQITDGF